MDIDKKADKIITEKVLYAMGAGLIPVPIIDVITLTKVQIDMMKALSELYDADYYEVSGEALVTSITMGFFAKAGASLIKFIPVVGTIVGDAALAVISGASTYALGRVFIKYLKEEGTLMNIDIKEARVFYKKMYEKGKDVAENLFKKVKKENSEEIHDVETEDEDKK
jgi:uncharacterized protein (DUF697 family)